MRPSLKGSRSGIEAAVDYFRDPVLFASRVLLMRLTAYQEVLLRDLSRFLVLRWCRQSGKTTCVAAHILWYALTHPNANIGIVSPSMRQSKRAVEKVAALFHGAGLPRSFLVGRKALKTRIEFANGATIEAFPNSPDTIRGPSFDLVYWDEVNFTPDDERLYEAILFALATTGGRLIASSTPWSRDSVFYKMCFDDHFAEFSRHHVSWREALSPGGLLDEGMVDAIRRQTAGDQGRWRREMEAEFAEEEGVWFRQELITSCIDPELEAELISEEELLRAEPPTST